MHNSSLGLLMANQWLKNSSRARPLMAVLRTINESMLVSDFLEGYFRDEQSYMRKIADLLLIWELVNKLIFIPNISCMHLASCGEIITQGWCG